MSAICPGFINTPIMEKSRLQDIGAREQARFRRAFAQNRPPRAVANAIVGAVERDRAVVPVGFESSAALHLQRVTPIAVQTLVARLG